ncbi:MAG: hypothetical protein IJ270_02985, partial [Paludibacteraceae bacterium]|nr:hypothetical protein [Paludibacteraceae bacterium]
FELKNTIEYPIKKSTMFGPIAASNNYTLESVKGNIVNVKSTSVMENDILIPALVDFSMEKIKGIKDGMSGLIQSKDENMDEKKFMENQRIEIEQNIKQNFDLTMMDKFKYSYNKSTQWIASLEGITTLKGKVKDKDTNVVTEITIKKK